MREQTTPRIWGEDAYRQWPLRHYEEVSFVFKEQQQQESQQDGAGCSKGRVAGGEVSHLKNHRKELGLLSEMSRKVMRS